jgi:nucleoside-diphosphate-sugar epimerase
MEDEAFIIGPEDPILVTGATGFIGLKVVECLLNCGFRKMRAFARSSSEVAALGRAPARTPWERS